MKKVRLDVAILAVSLLTGYTAVQAAPIQIPAAAILGDATTIDFTGAPTGAIGGMNALFTSAGYSSVALVGTHSGCNNDTWNSGTMGNGLAAVSGGLAVVAPGQRFCSPLQSAAGFQFNIAGLATQFGFQIIDQVNFNVRVETFLGAASLGFLDYNQGGGFPVPARFFSDVAFDRWQVTCNQGGCGGWGLDNIVTAGFVSIPEPATLVLFSIGLAGLGFARRNRKI